jgi:hypothetical protein
LLDNDRVAWSNKVAWPAMEWPSLSLSTSSDVLSSVRSITEIIWIWFLWWGMTGA